MANLLHLHQTLHGYADGHQLLASSIELTREQQWQLLVMSDLSGPSFRAGFESYITGYPIVGAGHYCLGRTWFAPELPRSGCVWTHTILISDTDVARVADFRSIARLWRRPIKSISYESYSDQLPVEQLSELQEAIVFDVTTAEAVIEQLYDDGTRTVVLPRETSGPYEDFALALLNQQWPRLRRNFRFCTGALSVRDAAFDFLVTPPNTIRVEASDVRYSIVPSHRITRLSEEWVKSAARDLVASMPHTELRRFLAKFGPDYTEGRTVFRALCEVFFASRGPKSNPAQTLSAVAHFFPEPDSSRRLKIELFGSNSDGSRSKEETHAVLRALVVHPAGGSIPLDIADIASRTHSLTESSVDEAVGIATTALDIGGDRAEVFLTAFSHAIGEQPSRLGQLPLALVIDLVRRRPEFVGLPEIWARPREEQADIAGRLSSLPSSLNIGGLAVRGVLTGGAAACLGTILSQYETEGVAAVLRWYDEAPSDKVGEFEAIQRALGEHRRAVVATLAECSLGPRALRAVSLLLDPRARSVRDLGVRPWAPLATVVTPARQNGDALRSSAFLLGLGLSLDEPEAATLVANGFSSVYEAARENLLDEHLWELVEPFLPWHRRSWDRCARLIRGAVRSFTDRDWSGSAFVASFATSEQLSRAMQEADDSYDGRKYARRICKLWRRGDVLVDEDRSDIVRKFCEDTE